MRHRWEGRRVVAQVDRAVCVALAEWPAPALITAPDAPGNPYNEHWFECPCTACSFYWTSEEGTRVFWDWMRRRPRL